MEMDERLNEIGIWAHSESFFPEHSALDHLAILILLRIFISGDETVPKMCKAAKNTRAKDDSLWNIVWAKMVQRAFWEADMDVELNWIELD